jgi:hypothetical protein
MSATELKLKITCPIMVRTNADFYCEMSADIANTDLEIQINWNDTKIQTMYLGRCDTEVAFSFFNKAIESYSGNRA